MTLDEARVLIGKLLRSESKSERKLPTIPLKEWTTDAIWSKLGVQVFKEDLPTSVTSQDTFVIKQGKAHRIGSSYGGGGVTSLCVADLRRNGRPLLVYAYRCGMSLPALHINVCDCLAEKPTQLAWGPVMIHAPGPDWTVEAVDDHTARVHMGKTVLGDLVLEDKKDRTIVRLKLRDDVPPEIKRHLQPK